MFPSRDFTYSVYWNLFLILTGSIIQAVGLKGIATVHGFVPSGLFGVSTLIYYLSEHLNPGAWYMLLNIPMFALGWKFISRRFMLYSLLGMATTSLAFMAIDFQMGIRDQLYAAVCFGVLSGAGAGIVLRSLGSNGGLDVAAVIFNQRFNLGVGKFYFFFNFFLFSFSFASLDNDLVIASLIAMFVASVTVEYCLSLFNQRKVAMIISPQNEAIAAEVMDKLKIGATILKGHGAYQKTPRNLLMVVINNIQLKRLEEIVFTTDDQALFIVENTFAVIGSTFSKRKIY